MDDKLDQLKLAFRKKFGMEPSEQALRMALEKKIAETQLKFLGDKFDELRFSHQDLYAAWKSLPLPKVEDTLELEPQKAAAELLPAKSKPTKTKTPEKKTPKKTPSKKK